MTDKESNKLIIESIQEQIGSVGAVKGEPFAHLVSLCITAISLMKVSSVVEVMVKQAAVGNPPPEQVVSGYLNLLREMLATMAAAAAAAGGLNGEQAEEAMDWATRIADGAQQSHDAMEKLKGE